MASDDGGKTGWRIVLVLLLVVAAFSGGLAVASGLDRGESTTSLRIDQAAINGVTLKQAQIADTYISTLVNFATDCENNTVFRTIDFQERLVGATLFCKDSNETFTLWYSDKWRRDMYGRT